MTPLPPPLDAALRAIGVVPRLTRTAGAPPITQRPNPPGLDPDGQPLF